MYIALEGLDGSGKTTQIELLKKKLEDYKFIKEPYYFNKELKELLLYKRYRNPVSQILLFLAAHAELHTKEMSNDNIISDRSLYSTLAYAYGYNGNLMQKVISAIRMFSINRYPDVVIFLSGSHGISEEPDAIESMPKAYFQRVRDAYDILYKKPWSKWYMVNGLQDKQKVHKEIVNILKKEGVHVIS